MNYENINYLERVQNTRRTIRCEMFTKHPLKRYWIFVRYLKTTRNDLMLREFET